MTSLQIKPAPVAQPPQAVRERRQAAARRQRWFYLALLGVALVAPLAVYPVFLMKLLCFALFACAFNLLLGYAGLLSFGHAAFLATGGYVTGYLLSQHSGLGTELGILAGTLASTLLGLGFGLLAIRRQGIYFAMIWPSWCSSSTSRRRSPAARTACTGCRAASCWGCSTSATT